MAHYRSNSPESIREIFDKEGDALNRTRFVLPDLSERPEELGEDRGSLRTPIPAESDGYFMEMASYVSTFGLDVKEEGGE